MLAALPPVVATPAPYEASFGHIVGVAPEGARRVIVRVGRRVLAERQIQGRRFDFFVSLLQGEQTVRVVAGGRAAVVPHVFGLPRAARPRPAQPREHPPLAREVVAFGRSFGGTSGIYVQDLSTGAGAAWNARARFPAASTLKVAIALEVLRVLRGRPPPGSSLDRLLRAMVVDSDNDAANRLEVFLAGSTSAGGRRVTELMRSLGLVDSEMYGGYERSTQRRVRPIPLRTEEQPAFGRGKSTSAYDLARLFSLVHLAAEGQGLLARRYRGQLTSADARYLLYLLVHAQPRGLLDRLLPKRCAVAHKPGWISTARHDAGLVYWPGGVFVAVVMTWQPSGLGPAADVLAAQVARAALAKLG